MATQSHTEPRDSTPANMAQFAQSLDDISEAERLIGRLHENECATPNDLAEYGIALKILAARTALALESFERHMATR
jgi:hypothetical protein